MDEDYDYIRSCNNEEVPYDSCENKCCIDCHMKNSCCYKCTDIVDQDYCYGKLDVPF